MEVDLPPVFPSRVRYKSQKLDGTHRIWRLRTFSKTLHILCSGCNSPDHGSRSRNFLVYWVQAQSKAVSGKAIPCRGGGGGGGIIMTISHFKFFDSQHVMARVVLESFGSGAGGEGVVYPRRHLLRFALCSALEV